MAQKCRFVQDDLLDPAGVQVRRSHMIGKVRSKLPLNSLSIQMDLM